MNHEQRRHVRAQGCVPTPDRAADRAEAGSNAHHVPRATPECAPAARFGSSGAAGAHKGSGRRGTIAVRPPNARSRRCVIEGSVRQGHTWEVQGGESAPGLLGAGGCRARRSAGKLYGADQGFDAQTFRTPMDGEQRQFRFIVAPEDGERLDLKEFTRGFMRQVEKDTGRSLSWTAVNHYNTEQPPRAHRRARRRSRRARRSDRRPVHRAGDALARPGGSDARAGRDLIRDRSAAHTDVGREALTPIDRASAHYQKRRWKAGLEENLGDDGRVGLVVVVDDLNARRSTAGRSSMPWRMTNGLIASTALRAALTSSRAKSSGAPEMRPAIGRGASVRTCASASRPFCRLIRGRSLARSLGSMLKGVAVRTSTRPMKLVPALDLPRQRAAFGARPMRFVDDEQVASEARGLLMRRELRWFPLEAARRDYRGARARDRV